MLLSLLLLHGCAARAISPAAGMAGAAGAASASLHAPRACLRQTLEGSVAHVLELSRRITASAIPILFFKRTPCFKLT